MLKFKKINLNVPIALKKLYSKPFFAKIISNKEGVIGLELKTRTLGNVLGKLKTVNEIVFLTR